MTNPPCLYGIVTGVGMLRRSTCCQCMKWFWSFWTAQGMGAGDACFMPGFAEASLEGNGDSEREAESHLLSAEL